MAPVSKIRHVFTSGQSSVSAVGSALKRSEEYAIWHILQSDRICWYANIISRDCWYGNKKVE